MRGREPVPQTIFGLVTETLLRRRDRGIATFTVMSCDNIQGNGDVTRQIFSAFAHRRSDELAQWIEQHVGFPNGMVSE